jgi:hypothetical protein
MAGALLLDTGADTVADIGAMVSSASLPLLLSSPSLNAKNASASASVSPSAGRNPLTESRTENHSVGDLQPISVGQDAI